MCGTPRLEAAVLPLLKRAVLSAYASDAAGVGCAWLAAAAPAGGGGSGSQRAAGASFECALLAAVRWLWGRQQCLPG
jgi:hypothetical protein